MTDGIYEVTCKRCNCAVGAQRFQNGKVVEEEFYPDVQKEGDNYWCKHCYPLKDTQVDIEEFLVDLHEVEGI